MPSMSAPPAAALFELARIYARGADRRHAADFVGAFAPDGRLSVCATAEPGRIVRTLNGSGELATVPQSLTRYARTFHLLGQANYECDGDAAIGEVYCVAHHLTVDDVGATNKVMYIRYADDYRIDPDGLWRIAHRRVQIDWTETRPADCPDAQ
jgi:hypothetical protein